MFKVHWYYHVNNSKDLYVYLADKYRDKEYTGIWKCFGASIDELIEAFLDEINSRHHYGLLRNRFYAIAADTYIPDELYYLFEKNKIDYEVIELDFDSYESRYYPNFNLMSEEEVKKYGKQLSLW